MQGRNPARRRLVACVAATTLAALSSLALGWGFTVDDALISTRVAHHWITGHGYRFNVPGPISDCVTPLGWAALLAPLSASGAWQGLLNARLLGVLCHLATALVLGLCLARTPARAPILLCVCLALGASLPWGAWASSGMETPLVTLLVSLGLFGGRPGLIGPALAAGLRPELVPWAFVLGMARPANGPGERIGNVALALSGAALVAALRVAFFGQPAPLSVFAKPSDFAHGLSYALGAFVFTALPLLTLSGRAFTQLCPHAKSLALALLAHLGALVIAGGDWMALYRLFVPLLPTAAWLAASLLSFDSRALRALKLGACVLATALLAVGRGSSARSVLETRTEVLGEGARALDGARVVAALDVGWVGAAGAYQVVDLAGITDPEIAVLPGGHTSKRVPSDLLYRREVDSLVLLLAPGADYELGADWRAARYARQVEQRVTQLELSELFVPTAQIPLGETGQRYLVLRRAAERVAGARGARALR